jgi:GNAT superfamily N-acetyltransferase
LNELERVEAQAMREIATLAGARAGTAGGALCISYPETPTPSLNWALPVGAHVDVDAVLRWFDGAPHMFSTHDDLSAHGYTRGHAWMKFERGDEPAPSVQTDLRIEETRDGALFARVCADGFGLPDAPGQFVGSPGFACFLAWDGDEPAACAALYADGDSAWLGVAATKPGFRGRGAQGALLSARIDAARAAGAKRLVTETGERPGSSYRNIVRAGFREAYLRPNWQSPR